MKVCIHTIILYQYNIFEKTTLNVVWNFVNGYCFSTTETIYSVLEFYSSTSLCLREGLFNAHNLHYWAEENPFVIRERSFQVRWKLNIWAGIIGDQIIRPCVLPNRMRGDDYTDFLRDNLPDLLKDLPLNIR